MTAKRSVASVAALVMARAQKRLAVSRLMYDFISLLSLPLSMLRVVGFPGTDHNPISQLAISRVEKH
jgi:hypothetical protein